jgi:quinol monooxygenase YgiN
MPQVAQFARFRGVEGKASELRAALEDAAKAASEEPGTLIYAIHQDAAEPNTLWLYELYDSVESQQAHSSSGATSQLRSAVGDLLQEPLSVSRGTPVTEKGLPRA